MKCNSLSHLQCNSNVPFQNSICIASCAMAQPMQVNMDAHAQLQCNSARTASHTMEMPARFIPRKLNAHANARQYILPHTECKCQCNLACNPSSPMQMPMHVNIKCYIFATIFYHVKIDCFSILVRFCFTILNLTILYHFFVLVSFYIFCYFAVFFSSRLFDRIMFSSILTMLLLLLFYYFTILPFYYFTILLFHYFTTLLFHFTISRTHYFTILLGILLFSYFNALQFHDVTILVFHYYFTIF